MGKVTGKQALSNLVYEYLQVSLRVSPFLTKLIDIFSRNPQERIDAANQPTPAPRLRPMQPPSGRLPKVPGTRLITYGRKRQS